jgi:hypothetical protein
VDINLAQFRSSCLFRNQGKRSFAGICFGLFDNTKKVVWTRKVSQKVQHAKQRKVAARSMFVRSSIASRSVFTVSLTTVVRSALKVIDESS